MRYMMLYKPGFEQDGPPSQEEMEQMGRLIEDTTREGILLATDGLQHSAKGARVARNGSGYVVTDGPFTEAKELVAGFAIMRLPSHEAAVEQAKRFLNVVGAGEVEIRLMHDEHCA